MTARKWDIIKTNLLERMVSHMPQYHSYSGGKGGRVIVTPSPFWRRIPILKRFFPYFVGQRVEFILQLDEVAAARGHTHDVVYERFLDEESILQDLKDKMTKIVGSVIPREGNVEYSYGWNNTKRDSRVLFTAQVINTDRWSLGCIGLLAGFVVAIASGIALGFIKIEPILKVFITP